MKIIAIVNQKGGVGKTTTAINVGAYLASFGRETLLIDLDPQGNATSGLGIEKNSLKKTIYHSLLGETPLEEIILNTEIDWLDLAPSNMDLVGAEIELINFLARESRLKKKLEQLPPVYQYILIDCPPSLNLLTVNALTAAQSVFIPLQCEYYALEGLGQLLKTMELVRSNLNPRLVLEGVLLTLYDSRLNLANQVIEEVKKFFTDKVYAAIIPRSVRLAEAPSFGKPVLLYAPHSKGAEAYAKLTEEIIQKEA
jgi:chromosome partitioning protein